MTAAVVRLEPADAAGLHLSRTAPGATEPLQDGWRALADAAAEDNGFFLPGFLLPAIDHVADSPVMIASIADAEGRLLALAPVADARFGRVAPAVRVWSHRFGPLGVPLIAADSTREALHALASGLAPAESGLSLILPHLPVDGPVAAAVRAFAADGGRPAIVVGSEQRATIARTDPDPITVQSRHRRREFQRQLRRLGDRGPVAYASVEAPAGVRARLCQFLELEAAGWKGRRGTALASSTVMAQFARKVVFERATAGSVRIDSLDVGGHPAAMVISFVSGRTMFTWKTAYDESIANLSPGALLMLSLPAQVFSEDRIDIIDSCAEPNHPMIDRLWQGRRDIGTLVVGPPGGRPVFQLAEAAARAEHEARQVARRLRDNLRRDR